MKPFIEVSRELESWKPETERDDNIFQMQMKHIDRKATSMKEKLTKANSDLSQACSNEVFGDKFTTSIETFCHTSPLNTLINNKISETMNEFSRRGLSDHQAAMSLENIKAIIPAFNGENAFSVIDAFDTYRTKLSQSGISRSMWGNIVLSKISGEARSRISILTQRNPDIDDIETVSYTHLTLPTNREV